MSQDNRKTYNVENPDLDRKKMSYICIGCRREVNVCQKISGRPCCEDCYPEWSSIITLMDQPNKRKKGDQNARVKSKKRSRK